MLNVVGRILCRLAGVSCSASRPSSQDLKREMQERGNRVQARTVELRRQRNVMESAFKGKPGKQHGR